MVFCRDDTRTDLGQRRVVNGVACSMMSRGANPCNWVTLVDSVMAVAINGPGSSFHVFHVFSRENVFRQRARCAQRDSLRPPDFLSLHSPELRAEILLVRASELGSSGHF